VSVNILPPSPVPFYILDLHCTSGRSDFFSCGNHIGIGRGADNPTLEGTFVTKSEVTIAGYFSWQKLLRKARVHVELLSQC
jgi:hypothetical protein